MLDRRGRKHRNCGDVKRIYYLILCLRNHVSAVGRCGAAVPAGVATLLLSDIADDAGGEGGRSLHSGSL